MDEVLEVAAQQVEPVELRTTVLDYGDHAADDETVMNEVRQALEVQVVFLDDEGIEVPAPGNEFLLILHTCLH
jgi:hypothetical protein